MRMRIVPMLENLTNLYNNRELREGVIQGSTTTSRGFQGKDKNCTNARELDKLIQQQRTIERELSRVLQQLAEASKVRMRIVPMPENMTN